VTVCRAEKKNEAAMYLYLNPMLERHCCKFNTACSTVRSYDLGTSCIGSTARFKNLPKTTVLIGLPFITWLGNQQLFAIMFEPYAGFSPQAYAQRTLI
jgi:hypothetical protein